MTTSGDSGGRRTPPHLDGLVAALEAIVAEAKSDPELLHKAPRITPRSRLDEAQAARKPRLRYTRDS